MPFENRKDTEFLTKRGFMHNAEPGDSTCYFFKESAGHAGKPYVVVTLDEEVASSAKLPGKYVVRLMVRRDFDKKAPNYGDVLGDLTKTVVGLRAAMDYAQTVYVTALQTALHVTKVVA